MKQDLLGLMERENIDALWITGSARHNPAMTYFTGSVHLGLADLFIKQGQQPVIYCNPMERDEAPSTGLEIKVRNLDAYMKHLAESGGDTNQAAALEMKQTLETLKLTKSRISLYGLTDTSTRIGVLDKLRDLLPELDLIGEGGNSILLETRATKDEAEIDRIRRMGEITTGVVHKTAELLQNCQVNNDEVLLNEEGIPLTVGQVKRMINLWLAEDGVENPKGTIFALGRDAGIPHSAGKEDDQVCLGKTIIFDIFPQEAGGGYFFDFTRTWCLGYAPEPEAQLYQDVKDVYDQIMAEMDVDVHAPVYQERTCELFEERGHPTLRQDYQLQSGYVHSLGHGLGLNVRERPWFGKDAGPKDILFPGSVVTIEPGLYYPEKGMGCRIEDTIYVRPDGQMEVLADYSYDFVLPMVNWKG